jgi:hypothetical protein
MLQCMAEMIPESFRGENSGERRIFAILRDGLPDDHLAYHAPVLDLLPENWSR